MGIVDVVVVTKVVEVVDVDVDGVLVVVFTTAVEVVADVLVVLEPVTL